MSAAPTSSLKFKLEAFAAGIWIPWPSPENVCDGLLNTECPLDENEEVSFRVKMSVPKLTPNLDTIAEAKITNDAGDVILCFRVDIQIRKK